MHPEPEGQALLLQQHRPAAGQRTRAVRAQRLAVDLDDAVRGLHVARERRQQGGLAGPVGTDQRDHLAAPHRQVDAVEDAGAAEGDPDAGGPQGRRGRGAHAQPPALRRARRSSQKKNGPPTNEVSIPMGRSA